MSRPVNTDLAAGLIGLALAIVFWIGKESNWSFWSAVFPDVIIVVIAALSLLLLVKAFVRPRRRPVFVDGDRRRMLITSVVLVAWGVAFSELGTVVSSVLGMTGLALYLSMSTQALTRRNILSAAAVLGVLLTVFYLIFTRILYVPLPRGVLF